MSRNVFILTDTFQQVASGVMMLTVEKGFTKFIALNDTASDTAAYRTQVSDDTQIQQDEDKPTFAKGAGISVIIDSVV